MDRLQGSSNIDETRLPSRGRRERMKEGRVKTRPVRVNTQRGEVSKGGCNVDRPSSSPRHLDPCSFDEVVTMHSFSPHHLRQSSPCLLKHLIMHIHLHSYHPYRGVRAIYSITSTFNYAITATIRSRTN